MIAPYYLNITFKGIETSAKARMLHADGSKVYEILFPTKMKNNEEHVTGKGKN